MYKAIESGLDASSVCMAVLKARADSSNLTYLSGYTRWMEWCKVMKIASWPFGEVDLSLCLINATQEGLSESAVLNMVEEVFPGSSSNKNSSTVAAVRKYVKRFAIKKNQKKEPLSYQDLCRMHIS